MTGQRLLHVAIEDDWEACDRFGEYTVATRHTGFEETGYLHATTASHLGTVLEEVYGDLDLPLLLIVVDEDALVAEGIEVRWVSDHSGDRSAPAPRIMGELPMQEPVLAAVIPLHRNEGHWQIPDLTSLNVREGPPSDTVQDPA